MARYADYLYESDLEDLFSDEEEVNRAYDHCLAVVLGIVTCDFLKFVFSSLLWLFYSLLLVLVIDLE